MLLYSQMAIVDTFASLPASALKGQLGYCQDTGLAYQFDGSFWTPSARVQVKKSSASVNLKATGATLLYTLEASNFNFYPTQIVLRATGVGISGVTLSPTFSIGTNATTYNNIASATLLATLITTLTGGSSLTQNVNSPSLAGGATIFINVTTAALATNYTVLVDIIGFYDN